MHGPMNVKLAKYYLIMKDKLILIINYNYPADKYNLRKFVWLYPLNGLIHPLTNARLL